MKKFLTTLLLLLPLLLFSQDTIYDCAGTDVSAISSWIGDGYCDDGAYSYGGSSVYFLYLGVQMKILLIIIL